MPNNKEKSKVDLTKLSFRYSGKKYQPLLHAMIIPGIGRRTAMEVCADQDAQKYLVEEKCIGTAIKEIVTVEAEGKPAAGAAENK